MLTGGIQVLSLISTSLEDGSYYSKCSECVISHCLTSYTYPKYLDT